MTSQYGQQDINLRDGEPISITTQAAAVTNYPIFDLTENGSRGFVSVIGGGSDRATPGVNNYTLVVLTFQVSRLAGVITAEATLNLNISEGLGGTVAPAIVGDTIFLAIAGNALVANYDHRLKLTKIFY